MTVPPDAGEVPAEAEAAAEYAAAHPAREEARIVAGALRSGGSACALRLRSHDDAESVLTSTDLVPGLLTLLHATLELEETRS
jgi:hypothetical protein